MVTLITGDRVVLDGDRIGSLTGGPGREKVAFHTFERDGHLNVVPNDAFRALAEGRLDPRLFDVTELVASGYDDERRATVPIIIRQDAVAPLRAAAGLEVTDALPAVDAVAAEAAKPEASSAWQSLITDPSVTKIWLDGLRRPSLDRSVAQIGAPAAWAAGYTGTGTTVAVVDTGVDATHPDLAGQVVGQANFTDDPDNADTVGHGTHVAATIASTDTRYRGVAPDARLLDAKVCISFGCTESAILAGMTWAVEQGADVVNMSLGGDDTPEIDPLEEAVNTLSAQSGALFVVAAGNSGGTATVGSPGSADAALTVGAVDRDETIARFSSRGPRVGDGGVKPDITAPGVAIAAAQAAGTAIGTPVDETHVALSGTSMATPHVAGAAALLAQQHPDWTGARIKAALTASAAPNPVLTVFDQGSGRVDVAAAITSTLSTDPVSVSLGLQQWPHGDDVPVATDLTYRNDGAEPVTLELTLEARGPTGEPAPAGLLSLSASTVTVPAGGTAAVSVTADTRIDGPDGAYSGVIVTSAGLRTPISVVREVESYTLTLDHLGTDGLPTADYSAVLFGLDNDTFAFPYDEDGSVSVRVPRGAYFVANTVSSGPEKLAVLPVPNLEITRDTTVTVDARLAGPVTITPPAPDVEDIFGEVSITRNFSGGSLGASVLYFGGFGDGVTLGQIGPALPENDLSTMINVQSRGTPAGEVPVSYRLAWVEYGTVPTGFTRAPTLDELATVTTEFGPSAPGRSVGLAGSAVGRNGGFSSSWVTPVGASGRAIDHVTTDGVDWRWTGDQSDAERLLLLVDTDVRTYRPGLSYDQRLMFPPFGPSAPQDALLLSRQGDEIRFGLPLFSDADGNTGQSVIDTARTTLTRNGVPVGESPEPGFGLFTVPAGPGDFELRTEAVRESFFEFSTRVSGAWTFRSDTVAGEQPTPLPLTVVRFAPSLDPTGSTPGGRPLRVPLQVQQQSGADAGPVGPVRVEVSFDDGTTWSPVITAGPNALVVNPDIDGYGSLRVTGADGGGNTFEHTVVRAYKIKKSG